MLTENAVFESHTAIMQVIPKAYQTSSKYVCQCPEGDNSDGSAWRCCKRWTGLEFCPLPADAGDVLTKSGQRWWPNLRGPGPRFCGVAKDKTNYIVSCAGWHIIAMASAHKSGFNPRLWVILTGAIGSQTISPHDVLFFQQCRSKTRVLSTVCIRCSGMTNVAPCVFSWAECKSPMVASPSRLCSGVRTTQHYLLQELCRTLGLTLVSVNKTCAAME